MTTGAPRQASPSDEIQFSRPKTVLYSVVAVLLGLSVIEGVCAVIWTTIVPHRLEAQEEDVPIRFGMVNFPDIVEKDPWLFWQLKANTTAPLDQGRMTGFIANGDRMRNPEVPVERGPNDFRLLALGDSVTFGWGVRYEEAYPTLLADLLSEARPGREIHVMNASCSGYSTHQGLETAAAPRAQVPARRGDDLVRVERLGRLGRHDRRGARPPLRPGTPVELQRHLPSAELHAASEGARQRRRGTTGDREHALQRMPPAELQGPTARRWSSWLAPTRSARAAAPASS